MSVQCLILCCFALLVPAWFSNCQVQPCQACFLQLVPQLCRGSCSAKSTAAAKAARNINPSLNVNALQNRVSPATEDVFHDKFWESLDLIVNALDNVNARLYVDSRCVYFGKPLLESGTLGPKCNTQVVIPNMTENYGMFCCQCLTTIYAFAAAGAAGLAWHGSPIPEAVHFVLARYTIVAQNCT